MSPTNVVVEDHVVEDYVLETIGSTPVFTSRLWIRVPAEQHEFTVAAEPPFHRVTSERNFFLVAPEAG